MAKHHGKMAGGRGRRRRRGMATACCAALMAGAPLGAAAGEAGKVCPPTDYTGLASGGPAQAPAGVSRFACPPRPTVERTGADSVIVDFAPLRLTLAQTQKLGADVVAAQRHVNALSLDAGRAWRSEIDATIGGPDGPGLETEFRFGMFDTRRPIISTRGGFGTDELDRWRSNSVIDAAFALRGFGGRLDYSAGVASSETGLVRRSSDEPWLWVFEPDPARATRSRDAAIFQKFGAKLGEDGLTASVEALYTKTGEDFRSFQTNTPADILYEGETIGAVATLEAEKTYLSFEKNVHADRYYAFDENTLRFVRGAFGLKAGFSREEMRDSALLFSSDEIISARFQVKLSDLLSNAPDWAPDAVNFGASQRSSRAATLFNPDGAMRRSYGVGLTKAGANFATDIYVYWNERDDLASAGEFSGANEFGADIIHSFFFENWDLSLYAVMSDLARKRAFTRDGGETLLSGGVSFSRRFKALPDIEVRLDAFSFDAGYPREEYAFESRDVSLRIDADISETLLSGLGYVVDEERPFSVHLGAYQGWSVFDDALSSADNERETRLLLMLRRSR